MGQLRISFGSKKSSLDFTKQISVLLSVRDKHRIDIGVTVLVDFEDVKNVSYRIIEVLETDMDTFIPVIMECE